MKAPLFEAGPYRAIELAADDIPALQRFFEANPEYFRDVGGADPHPAEAREEFESMPPPEWPCGRKWVIGFLADDGSMVAMADIVADLLAEGVWNIGLFIVATSRHGTGSARLIHDALEGWMRAQGATWARLGVVAGNARAERFWEKAGYRDVRKRAGAVVGARTHTIRVMVKPLAGEDLARYLAKVERDRPDSP